MFNLDNDKSNEKITEVISSLIDRLKEQAMENRYHPKVQEIVVPDGYCAFVDRLGQVIIIRCEDKPSV